MGFRSASLSVLDIHCSCHVISWAQAHTGKASKIKERLSILTRTNIPDLEHAMCISCNHMDAIAGSIQCIDHCIVSNNKGTISAVDPGINNGQYFPWSSAIKDVGICYQIISKNAWESYSRACALTHPQNPIQRIVLDHPSHSFLSVFRFLHPMFYMSRRMSLTRAYWILKSKLRRKHWARGLSSTWSACSGGCISIIYRRNCVSSFFIRHTSFCAEAVSHIRTVLSKEPDASSEPLGENSTV